MTTVAPLAYSPYDYEIHEDPYPTYARLRAEAPSTATRSSTSGPARVTRTCWPPSATSTHYSNAYGVSPGPGRLRPRGPPGHVVPRHGPAAPHPHALLVGKGFTPRRVAAMEERIRRLALEHLEPALEAGSFDFIADFAGKLPMDVISELVGVPVADRAELRRLADLVAAPRGRGVRHAPRRGWRRH